jgi:hypothetical protein
MKPFRNIFPLILLLTAVALAQTNPVPLINNPLVPDATAPGGAGFTLTVNGTGFVPSSVVDWNGTALATTFVSGSQLTATVPAGNIATASTALVTVLNPAPGGGKSNMDFFQVRQPFTAVSFGISSTGTGDDSFAPITADLNNDLKLDLVTINLSSATVSSLLGNGNGTFELVGEYSVGSSPLSAVAADFNGDGNLDLAVAGLDSIDSIAILLGNGDGTFQPQQDISIPNLQGNGVSAADFNGDGKLDLAVANTSSNDIFVLMGNGDGTFQNPVSYAAGNNVGSGLAMGDFNKDGKLDLAVPATYDNAIALLFGNGDGTFQNPVEVAIGKEPVNVIAADFNGDGNLDLVAGCILSGGFAVILGNGDGTFQSPILHGTVDSDYYIAVGDVNGDGILDVTMGNQNSTVQTYLGNGDGTFQQLNTFPANGNGFFSLGDFNNDGILDMAVAGTGSTSLSLLPGTTSVVSQTLVGFGKIKVGSTKTMNVTLSNIGNAAFTISHIGLTGQNGTEYSESNTCGKGLSSGASCTITVTFKPHKRGFFPENINVSDSAVTPPQTIYLGGTGTLF